jgi:hypothetical protein
MNVVETVKKAVDVVKSYFGKLRTNPGKSTMTKTNNDIL